MDRSRNNPMPITSQTANDAEIMRFINDIDVIKDSSVNMRWIRIQELPTIRQAIIAQAKQLLLAEHITFLLTQPNELTKVT